MRWLFALLVAMVTTPAWCTEADEFPYTATVTKSETEVRSGPGKNFYATDKLSEGAVIEVHRHDPGGWRAIRPPDGSFSWVRARYLEFPSAECPCIAIVNGEDVVARVGSSLTEARDIIQVHLEKDEPVELVDGDEEKPGTWRKIAPPSGEFRWVLLDAIERSDEPLETADVDKKNPETKDVENIPETTDVGKKTPTPAATAKDVVPAADQAATKNVVPAVHEGASKDVVPTTLEGAAKEVVRAAHEEEVGPTLNPPPPSDGLPAPSRRRRLSRTALQQEIVDIDLELSTRAAEDASTWNFDDLHARAERALEGAPTALDRAAVRELMAKLDRFERIFDGHADQQLAEWKPTRPLTPESGPVEAPQVLADTSRFDGVGRLARVVSNQINSPRWALVDATGTVRYYINAAPGVNLTPFLNKEVGVNGTRSSLAAKKSQILSAKRITEIPPETKRY